MVTSSRRARPSRLYCLLALVLFISVAVCINGHPGWPRPRPNAEQSRFAVCGLAAGRGFPKHEDEGSGEVDTGRIVGGREAKLNEIHYIVSLQQEVESWSTNYFTHKCGGAIYSATWIITAAHCFPEGYNNNTHIYQVVAGEHELYLPEDGEQTVAVKRIIEHPLYNQEDDKENDIALLELAKPLKFTKNIRPVKLPSCDYVPAGNATISGWGLTTAQEIRGPADYNMATSLRVAEVDVYTRKQCEEIVPRGLKAQNNTDKYVLHENAFCAGKLDRSVDSCQGDSGGPLVCHDKDGDVLCGLSSYGWGCGLKDIPGGYTYVPHFRDWIVHVTSGG